MSPAGPTTLVEAAFGAAGVEACYVSLEVGLRWWTGIEPDRAAMRAAVGHLKS